MIKFDETEIEYIKKSMQNVLDIWENGTKEELEQYIEDIGGEILDIVILISRNDWFLLDKVNKIDCINSKIKDFCYYGLGMWVWVDSYMDTAAEVLKYVPDTIYCNIYRKIISK
jgi:hypothetical protein